VSDVGYRDASFVLLLLYSDYYISAKNPLLSTLAYRVIINTTIKYHYSAFTNKAAFYYRYWFSQYIGVTHVWIQCAITNTFRYWADYRY
jgi:hypothetical protein